MSAGEHHMGRPCDSYAPNPYPGEIPPWSFVVDDDLVVRRLSPEGGDYTDEHGCSLSDRVAARGLSYVPVAVYGSNACPGRLVEKFGGGATGFVALRGTLHGAVRVWSARPSSRGSVPLTLGHAPGESDDAHLMLIPASESEHMDRTEGRGGPYYALGRLDTCRLELPNGVTWERPIAYVGHSQRGPLLHRGRPVRFHDAGQDSARKLAGAAQFSPTQADALLPPMTEIPSALSLTEAVDALVDEALLRWLQPAPPAGV